MAIDFPNSPSDNDIYTVNGKRWIYSSGKWSIYGSTAPDATASDTEPTGVGDGHIWYRSDESQTLIRYDNTWVEVGSAGGFDNASTNFPTSLDSATGFAAVEALQAKVGVDSSAVTSSHDYKIADHASRITTLESAGGAGVALVSRTAIGTAVSSVSVSNCFSSSYDNYEIIVHGGVASTNNVASLRLGSTTTGYYRFIDYGFYNSSAHGGSNLNNGQYFNETVKGTTSGINGHCKLFGPYLSGRTGYSTVTAEYSTTGIVLVGAGFLNDSTSYTGFTLVLGNGTWTGGHVDVYGYAKA